MIQSIAKWNPLTNKQSTEFPARPPVKSGFRLSTKIPDRCAQMENLGRLPARSGDCRFAEKGESFHLYRGRVAALGRRGSDSSAGGRMTVIQELPPEAFALKARNRQGGFSLVEARIVVARGGEGTINHCMYWGPAT